MHLNHNRKWSLCTTRWLTDGTMAQCLRRWQHRDGPTGTHVTGPRQYWERLNYTPPPPGRRIQFFQKSIPGHFIAYAWWKRGVVEAQCFDPSRNKVSRVAYQYYCSEVTQITKLFPSTVAKSNSSFALLQTSYFIIGNNTEHLAFCTNFARYWDRVI
jgi:hypothetical protein